MEEKETTPIAESANLTEIDPSELIPEDLMGNFSPLDKMLLSKFRQIPEDEPVRTVSTFNNGVNDSKKYNNSCLKIVKLIKTFLEEERVNVEEVEKDYKIEEKETAETESKISKEEDGFKLFN